VVTESAGINRHIVGEKQVTRRKTGDGEKQVKNR
jgi:hypothetical protein